MRTIMVGGKYDPIHQGHIESIVKASKLGDYLYIVVNPDDIVAKKSAKGFCAIPLRYRIMLLEGLLLHLNIKGEVLVSSNPDGTVLDELETIKPSIFAKGGDRTPNNMPANEVDMCKKLGIAIVYGVGDLLNSSSKIWKRREDIL